LELQYTRIIMRLLFLLLFIGFNSYSQKINLGDFSGYKNSTLDTLNQELELYIDKQIVTIDLNNFKKQIRPLTFGTGISTAGKIFSSSPIRVQDTLYFVYGSGGLVYQVKNDTVRRIDKSFDHEMQYGACVFEHNNTVFKYGGYGFWSDRDFFTYYDLKQDEWEVYHPIKSKVIPIGYSGAHFIKAPNRLHIFGGQYVNPQNRREKFENNKVWTFDFKTNKWNFLGKHEPLDVSTNSLQFKNKLLFVKTNKVTLIDIENNTKTIFKHSPISAQLNGFRYATYFDEKFYVIIGTGAGTFLNIVEEEDFFGEIAEQTKFYKNNNYWFRLIAIYGAVGLMILTILFLIKRNLRNLNKMQLMDNGLKYRNRFREFDKESIAILQLLLSHKEVPSSQVLRIVEKEQYSPAHNERIKVQKINDINLKIATLLGIQEDMVTNFKSPQDRRIRLYKISKVHFDLKGLKKLMA
jgi:hypothetical protein